MQETKLTIAVMIDYDNFNNENYLEVLFEELKDLGDVIVKEAYYSNFSDNKLEAKAIKHGFNPVMAVSHSKSQNAVDIKMIISIMDLLEKEYINCYCIASNDLDFAPIIERLKKENKVVFGAGNQTTNADYKKNFDRFINVDQIYNARQKSASEKEVKKVVNIVKKIISANESDEDGYVLLSTIVNQLYKEMPDFNPKVYGAKTNKTSSFFMKELNEYFLTKMEGTIVSIKSKNK